MTKKGILWTILLLCGLQLGFGGLAQTLTIYSGRNEAFVSAVIEAFETATGIEVKVRYGGTAPLAAQLLEEGPASPADVFLAQDAGALGAIAEAGLFETLPDTLLGKVEARFRSQEGAWVGITGRARVLVVGSDVRDLPASVFELTEERYRGRVGWAPTNGSFQAFVTGMRVLYGEERTAAWLRKMVANDAQSYPNNTSQVEAVGRSEIDFGLVNHYYLFRFTAENPDFPASNYYLPDADIGSLVNVAGAGVLASSDNREVAVRFVSFLLTPIAQRHFASEVNEYPLLAGVTSVAGLPPLSELRTPEIDLTDLADLEGTLELLFETGSLE
jgi:iron(III) transport system substrate-binding protein